MRLRGIDHCRRARRRSSWFLSSASARRLCAVFAPAFADPRKTQEHIERCCSLKTQRAVYIFAGYRYMLFCVKGRHSTTAEGFRGCLFNVSLPMLNLRPQYFHAPSPLLCTSSATPPFFFAAYHSLSFFFCFIFPWFKTEPGRHIEDEQPAAAANHGHVQGRCRGVQHLGAVGRALPTALRCRRWVFPILFFFSCYDRGITRSSDFFT